MKFLKGLLTLSILLMLTACSSMSKENIKKQATKEVQSESSINSSQKAKENALKELDKNMK